MSINFKKFIVPISTVSKKSSIDLNKFLPIISSVKTEIEKETETKTKTGMEAMGLSIPPSLEEIRKMNEGVQLKKSIEVSQPKKPTLNSFLSSLDLDNKKYKTDVKYWQAKNQMLIETNPKLKKMADFLLGVSGTVEGMAGAAELVAPETMKPFFKEKGDQVEEWRKSITPSEMTIVDNLISGAGSAATFYIPGLGIAKGSTLLANISPRLALLFGNVVSTALEAATEAGSVYRENNNQGKTEKESSESATRTFIANSILIGITNKLGIFSSETKTAVKRAILSAPMEGLQEYWQEVIQNVNTGKTSEQIFDNALESGIVGAILGGGMSVIGTSTGVLPIEIKNEEQLKNAIEQIEITPVEVAPKIAPEGKKGVSGAVLAEKGKIGQPIDFSKFLPKAEKEKIVSTIGVSGLAKTIKSKAIKDKIIYGFDERFRDLPDYDKLSNRKQAEKASEFILNNYDEAVQVAMGEKMPPSGLLPEDIYVALDIYATENKDVDLIRRLATESKLISEATQMGQRLQSLSQLNPDTAIAKLQQVKKAREEFTAKKTSKTKSQLAKELKTEIEKISLKKEELSWDKFLESIKC